MVYWSTPSAAAPARLRERPVEYGGESPDAGKSASAPGTPDPDGLARVPDPFDDAEALEELEERITTLAAHIAAAEHRFLVLLADFDRRRGWELGGHRDCAAWLCHRADMSRRTAQEKVRVARELVGLPRIGGAMSRGELSYSKVRSLTRVAEPDTEEVLLELGRSLPTPQLEKAVRGWRKASRATEERLAEEVHRLRRLAVFPDDEGSYGVRGRLTPEQGALVQRTLEAAADALFREEGAKRETTAKQRWADALVLVCKVALAAGLGEEAVREVGEAAGRSVERGSGEVESGEATVEPEGAEAGASGARQPRSTERGPDVAADGTASQETGPAGERRSTERPAAPSAGPRSTERRPNGSTPTVGVRSTERRPNGTTSTVGARSTERPGAPRAVSGATAERYLVFLHLDMDTLDSDSEPGRSNLEDGTRLSPGAARRLACDTSIVGVIRGEQGEVLDVGRKHRTTPPALRRALEIRDRGCRFPGCGVRWTEAHHVKHWAEGGTTDRTNCLLLCGHHHRLVHEGDWEVHVNNRDESALFIDPRGGFHMSPRPGPSLKGVEGAEEGAGWPEEVRRRLAARGKGPQSNGKGSRSNGTGSQPNGTGSQPNGTGSQPNGTGSRSNGNRVLGRPEGSVGALVHENSRRAGHPDGWSLTPRYRGVRDVPLDLYGGALEAFRNTQLG